MLIKKNLKYLFIFIVALIMIFISYLLIALMLSQIDIEKEEVSNADIPIFILSNGVHTEIAVPTQNKYMNWRKKVKIDHIRSTDTNFKYLSFGWGDEAFYLETPSWSDFKLSLALKALLGISPTVVHTTYYYNIHEDSLCKQTFLNAEQYKRLCTYLNNSFKKDSTGNFIPVETNAYYNNTDAFYQSTKRYTPFFTCNTWTNQALKSCGQKCCIWTPFEFGVLRHYKNKPANSKTPPPF